MKQVYIAQNPIEANFVKGILENEDIQAHVRGEWVFAVRGEVPMTPDTLPSVWVVHDSDFDRATEVVAEFSQKQEERHVDL